MTPPLPAVWGVLFLPSAFGDLGECVPGRPTVLRWLMMSPRPTDRLPAGAILAEIQTDEFNSLSDQQMAVCKDKIVKSKLKVTKMNTKNS